MANCNQCGAPMSGDAAICPKCLLGLGVATQYETSLIPGMTFHGLEIIQKLGRGGMGVVYKARQTQLERFVAVKVLLPSVANKELFSQRFTREAKALASLNHPNIVTVHDFGVEDDQYFLVMEFVDGTNLRALMTQNKLNPKEALKIVPKLCDALEYAHAQGVVHRDIKPENILIDKSGHIKVADFGLAKLTGSETGPSITQTDVVMGTPHYMAPEQYEGAKLVDHRADIYSMGVLFYEMLTGELPVGRFSPPSARKVDVDVRLDEVVLRALEKEPQKRYQSMSDVRRDVNNIADSNTLQRGHGIAGWYVAAAVAVLAIIAMAFAFNTKSNVPQAVPVNTTAAQPAPLTAVAAATPKQNEWDLAILTQEMLPPDWKMGDADESSEARMDVLKAARWWGMGEVAEGIEKFRRLNAQGADGREVGFFAYQTRDQAALDKCLAAMSKLYLPYPNRALIEKGNVFILISAKDNHDGYVTPAFEFVEDQVRSKMSVSPAKRIDHSAVKVSELPAKWTEIKSGDGITPLTAQKSADIPNLLTALESLPLPPAKEVRDGWVRCYGNPEEKGVVAKVISIRFLELDPAKKFTQQARTVDPPAGKETSVLRDGRVVVVLIFNSRETAKVSEFETFKKKRAETLGSGSDSFNIVARASERTEEKGMVNVPIEISGISAHELSRAGKWVVQSYFGDMDAKQEIAPPGDFKNAGEKVKTTLILPLTDDLKKVLSQSKEGFLNILIDWNLKGEDKISLQSLVK